MSSSPMYILVPYEKDIETYPEYMLNEDYLYQEADFVATFGSEGYVSSKEIHDTREKRISAAEEIIRYFGENICYLEDDTLVFEKDASLKYAEKKIKGVNDVLKDMTPEKYINGGEFELRNAIRSYFIYIHAWNLGSDEFIQSADSFVTHTLNYEDMRKFYVVQTWFCHN